MSNEEIKELKEKIIVLQNFHKVKDKKLKLFEEERERHNKLIAKQKERISRAIKYIENTYKGLENEDGSLPMTLHDQELLEILQGSDKEWVKCLQ